MAEDPRHHAGEGCSWMWRHGMWQPAIYLQGKTGTTPKPIHRGQTTSQDAGERWRGYLTTWGWSIVWSAIWCTASSKYLYDTCGQDKTLTTDDKNKPIFPRHQQDSSYVLILAVNSWSQLWRVLVWYNKNNNIIAPLSILSEDEWGDLECLYKARQAAITDGGVFTDTGVDERGENS